jgi:hypothetical protein
MNTSNTRHHVYRQVHAPVNFLVRSPKDVELIQVSFNQVRISGRVLTLPQEYWLYRHTDKLLNTQLASDPFDAQKLIVIPLPTKAEDGSERKQVAAAQHFRKPKCSSVVFRHGCSDAAAEGYSQGVPPRRLDAAATDSNPRTITRAITDPNESPQICPCLGFICLLSVSKIAIPF